MEQRDRRLIAGRLEVEVELRQLRARQQRLVDDGAAGERAHEKRRQLGAGLGDAGVDRVAREVQRPLPRGLIGPAAARGRGDERLAQRGAGGAGRGPEHGGIDRHVPPAEDREPVPSQDVLDDRRGASQRARLAGKEEGAHRERLAGLEVDPEPGRFLVEEAVGDLREEAGPVARRVGRGGATVRHPGHGLERQGEHLVRRLP